MNLTRNLKRYMTGEDVRWVKDYLFVMGYYDNGVTKITNSRYGNDTYKAVKAFQKANGLTVDGIYGKKSHAKLLVLINKADHVTEYVTAKDYPRISETARKAINTALNAVTKDRREFVLEALKYATDASIAETFEYPSSLYIRGGNLYNTDGKVNTITEKYLTNTYAKKYTSYCTSGRLDMMKKAVKENPEITGADCSGGIVGLLRHFGYVKSTFDTTANNFLGNNNSAAIQKTDLTAGDFVGKSGHICLYVGGGYMVEWAGGAYGCQLTEVSNRRCWDFVKKKSVKMAACTKYRKPKFYSAEKGGASCGNG